MSSPSLGGCGLRRSLGCFGTGPFIDEIVLTQNGSSGFPWVLRPGRGRYGTPASAAARLPAPSPPGPRSWWRRRPGCQGRVAPFPSLPLGDSPAVRRDAPPRSNRGRGLPFAAPDAPNPRPEPPRVPQPGALQDRHLLPLRRPAALPRPTPHPRKSRMTAQNKGAQIPRMCVLGRFGSHTKREAVPGASRGSAWAGRWSRRAGGPDALGAAALSR